MAQTEPPQAAGSDQSLGDLVATATRDFSTLVRCEIELAKQELKHDVKRAGLAGALVGAAVFVGCLMVLMAAFAFAYGLVAVGFFAWAAFLIVAGVCLVLVLLAAAFAFVGARGITGLRGTRQTVRDDISVLRRGNRRPGLPGPDPR